MNLRPLLWAGVIGLAACGSSRDVCQEAADRLAECLGVSLTSKVTCDPERAQSLLAQSCEQLSASAADAGKADQDSCGFINWLLGRCPPPLAQPVGCNIEKSVSTDTYLYAEPPYFTTRNGWILGYNLGILYAGTTVNICQRVRVGFYPGDYQTWARVSTSSQQYGWVYEGILE